MRHRLLFVLVLVAFVLPRSEAQVVTRLTPTNPDYEDDFSAAVALTEADDGTWALVGAPGDNDATGDAGSVFVYYRPDGGAWELQAQLFAPGEPLYQGGFGNAIALEGRLAVVGETGWDAPGQAYVLRREGEGMSSEWVVEAVLEPEALAHPDHVFGVDVALDTSAEAEAEGGFVAVVGAVTRGLLDPVPGAVHIFRRTVGAGGEAAWTEEALLQANEEEVFDRFGYAVAASSGHVAVGAFLDERTGGLATGGAVYSFLHDAGTWTGEDRIRPSVASFFGVDIDLDAEWLIAGATGEDCPAPDFFRQCGAVYFYKRASSGWLLRSRFQPTDLTAYDLFGSTTALALPYALVAAPQWDTEEPNEAGAAYLYRLDGSTWRFERLLRAPDPGRLDQFGRTVALSAETALVGTIEALGAAYAFDLTVLLPNAPAPSTAPSQDGIVFNLSIHPNPTLGHAHITYHLAAPASVRVEIADTLGRTVWVREVGWQTAGAHSLSPEGLDLPSGLYFVRVSDSTGDSTATSKFLHLGR